MSKILIIGGSSGIGLSACRVALESGHHVVAFSRHAEDINIQHENLIKFNGDALNYDDVSRAIDRCRCCFTNPRCADES